MSCEIDRPRLADAPRLAALHAACLPSSLLSVLGVRALDRYYRFAIGSPREIVLVTREGGAVIGGCVLSRDPDTLLSRFARSSPLAMASDLARAVAARPDLRARLRRRLGEASAPNHAPEIVQIFTEARHRGRGLGQALLARCEEALRATGDRGYTIRTHRDDNAAGIRFYQRAGFTPLGETRSFGDAFVVMKKELS